MPMSMLRTENHVDITVSLDSTAEEQGLVVMLKFRPAWQSSLIKVSRCTDGITNVILKYSYAEGTPEAEILLLRVYGKKTECLIDRARELKNLIMFHQHHLGPALIGTFANGYAYGYFEGIATGVEHMKMAEVYPLIAKKLAMLHRIPTTSHEPQLFVTLDKWISEVPANFPTPEQDKRFRDLDFPGLQSMLAKLRSTLEALKSPIVICHNDLLCKNIIFNQEEGQINFIDYEYSSVSFRGFDIANHFNEHAGVDAPDYKLFPNKEFQLSFLRYYLAELAGTAESDVSEDELEKTFVEVNKFVLASHFFWGVWAIIQALNSTLSFDFMGYAFERFGQFKSRYDELMSL